MEKAGPALSTNELFQQIDFGIVLGISDGFLLGFDLLIQYGKLTSILTLEPRPLDVEVGKVEFSSTPA